MFPDVCLSARRPAFCDLHLHSPPTGHLRASAHSLPPPALPHSPGPSAYLSHTPRTSVNPTPTSAPAAINGPVAGIGLALALFCDFRFTAREAKWTTAFSKLGLVAEHGTSWCLPRLVGTGKAMLMLMSSEVLLGEEAQRLGLAEKCFNKETLLDETIAFAQNLAATVPGGSLAAIKQQVWRHPGMDQDAALRQSNRLMSVSLDKAGDFKEGATAFMKKRRPDFPPLRASHPLMRQLDKEFGAGNGGTSRL